MNIKHKIIGTSIIAGVFIWIIDAVVNFLFFHEGPFLEVLIYDVHSHHLYIRLIGIGSFIIFGIIISKIISMHKQTKEALLEREDWSRTLLQNIQAAVVVHGSDTQIITGNTAANKLLGLTEEKMLGKAASDPVWNFLREDGSVMPIEEYPVNLVLNKKQPIRDLVVGICWTNRSDIIWVLVNADPVFDHYRNVSQVIVTFMDITHHKQAVEALRKSEENFRLVTENIQDIFWMSEPELSRMIYVSPMYEKIWGRSIDSLYESPQSFFDTVHSENREHVVNEVKKHAEEKWRVEYRIIQPDGSIRWILGRGFPIKDKEGNLIKMTGIATDITEQKNLEEKLKQYRCIEN